MIVGSNINSMNILWLVRGFTSMDHLEKNKPLCPLQLFFSKEVKLNWKEYQFAWLSTMIQKKSSLPYIQCFKATKNVLTFCVWDKNFNLVPFEQRNGHWQYLIALDSKNRNKESLTIRQLWSWTIEIKTRIRTKYFTLSLYVQRPPFCFSTMGRKLEVNWYFP